MKQELQVLFQVLSGVISAGVVVRVIFIFQNGRNADKSLTEIMQKAGKVIYAGIIAISLMSFSDWILSKFSVMQSADNLSDLGNVFVQFLRIVRDTAMAIAGGVTAWHFTKELILYQFGEEDEKPVHKKGAQKQLIIGVLILCAGGIVTVVLDYFR